MSIAEQQHHVEGTRLAREGMPTIRLNGVWYSVRPIGADDYGLLYDWFAVGTDYRPPSFVSRKLDEMYIVQSEVEAAERRAGWDPGP